VLHLGIVFSGDVTDTRLPTSTSFQLSDIIKRPRNSRLAVDVDDRDVELTTAMTSSRGVADVIVRVAVVFVADVWNVFVSVVPANGEIAMSVKKEEIVY